MKKIVIASQQELDKLTRIDADQDLTVDFAGDIIINNRIEVYGVLRMNARIICRDWLIGRESSTLNINGRESSTLNINGRGSSTLNIDGRGSSTLNIDGWGSSTLNINGRESSTLNIDGRESSTLNINGRESSTLNIDGWGSSTLNINGWESSTLNIDGWESSTLNIDGRESSTLNIDGRGSSTLNIDGRESSTLNINGRESSTLNIDGWGSSTLNINGRESSTLNIDGWESSTLNIDGWESSTLNIDGRGSSAIRLKKIICNVSISIAAFCCIWKPRDLNIAIKKKAETAVIIEYYNLPYLQRNCIDPIDGKVILYKRVSKDWKTQENTRNETVWTPGSSLIHPAWAPSNEECGAGKFHACHCPAACDEFRSNAGDRYVAIEILEADLFEWTKNPTYPHKIAFRAGTVLYECNRKGIEIK